MIAVATNNSISVNPAGRAQAEGCMPHPVAQAATFLDRSPTNQRSKGTCLIPVAGTQHVPNSAAVGARANAEFSVSPINNQSSPFSRPSRLRFFLPLRLTRGKLVDPWSSAGRPFRARNAQAPTACFRLWARGLYSEVWNFKGE
jgi:hypothetical protein